MGSSGETIQSKETLRSFLDLLDDKSKKIFWHFLCHEHVKLSELTDLIGASTDMEALHRIKEIINPAAVKIFDKPLLEFIESKIDRITGQKILFNWWLTGFLDEDIGFLEKGGKPLIDIFDEGEEIIIICEVSPSTTISDKAKIEQRHGILSIRLDKLR